MTFTFGWRKSAGLICFSWGEDYRYNLHFIVKKSYWLLGKSETWYDGPWYCFGLGPIFLFAWN